MNGISRRIAWAWVGLTRRAFDIEDINLDELIETAMEDPQGVTGDLKVLTEVGGANTITSLELPPGFTYEALHDALKARGYVIYAGQGDLAARIFRVANMGHLTGDQFGGFLAAVREVLAT